MGFLKKLLSKTADQDIKQTAKQGEKKVKSEKIAEKSKAIIKDVPAVIGKDSQLKEKSEKVKSEKSIGKATSLAQGILLFPLVTEKSAIAESENKYSFIVSNRATKEQIKKAILELYEVNPITVNTANYDGKYVLFRGKSGKRKGYKKAVVTLPKGKIIDIHKGV